MDGGPKSRWRCDLDTPECPPALVALLDDPLAVFCAHNNGFERAIWQSICVPMMGWPDLPLAKQHDSMAVAAMKGLPLGLERLGPVLRLAHKKDTDGSNFTVNLSKPGKDGNLPPLTRATMDRVVRYNDADLDEQWDVHHRLGWLPRREREVWLLDQEINERGLRLDMEYVAACKKVVETGTAPEASLFRQLTCGPEHPNGLEFTQNAKVLRWVIGHDFPIANLAKDTIDDLLGAEDEDASKAHDDAFDRSVLALPVHVERALRIRRTVGSSSVKKLRRMETCVSFDGRSRGLLQYHGAGPGRWAGRLLQPQNFPRGTIDRSGLDDEVEDVVAALMTGDAAHVNKVIGPPIATVVSGLRHAIVASPGHVLCSGDFAQIEARVLLALAGQHDKLDLMRVKPTPEMIASGRGDIYCDMATAIYRLPVIKPKDTDPDMTEKRQTGKNSVLGLGFQMGARKFRTRYCRQQELEFAQGVVDTYRKEWAPKVPKVWYALDEASLRAVQTGEPCEAYGVTYQREQDWLTALLPSGRKLWYFNPRLVNKEMPWSTKEEPAWKQCWTYQARKSGKWVVVDAFGGLLTENVAQALARDLMVAAMFRLRKAGYELLLTVHDEIVAEAPVVRADEKEFQRIMEEPVDWAVRMGVPVQVETWVGQRYKK